MSVHLAHYSVDLNAATHAAGAEGAGAPEWVELVPAGTFRGRDGRGPYTLDARAVIERTRAWHRTTDIAVDYDHQLVHAASKGGTAPAAGWVSDIEERNGAIWGRVRWTDRAAAHIAAGEYRYLSPVIPADSDGNVLVLLSVALTNQPNFDLPVAAVEHLHAALSHVHTKEQPVDPELKKLLEALGLDPAATQTEAAAAHAASLVAKAKALDGVVAGLGLAADAKPDDVVAGITALKTKAAAADAHAAAPPDPAKWVPKEAVDQLAAEVAGLKKASLENAAHTAVAEAMEAGKVTPALQQWAHAYAIQDMAGFKTWLDAAPVIVAPGAAHAARPPAAGAGGLDADEAAVASAMGLSAEDFKKAKEDAR